MLSLFQKVSFRKIYEITSPLFPEAVVAGEGEDVDVASDPETCIEYHSLEVSTEQYSTVKVYRTSYHSTVQVYRTGSLSPAITVARLPTITR